VASYFCTSDGSVLHAIAGPVDARVLLKEARWVEETRKRASLECHGDSYKTRLFWRTAHAERLLGEHQAPIDFRTIPATLTVDAFATNYLHRVGGGHGALDNKGKTHAILAVYPMIRLEHVYKVVFEKVLNEKVSTAPVAEVGHRDRK